MPMTKGLFQMATRAQRALAAALLGIGLTGGIVMAADPPTATPGGTAPTAQTGGRPPMGQPGPGGRGMDGNGPRGGPGGRGSATPTTASVTADLTRLTQELTSIKADRDFANGKTDLSIVNSLIDRASTLQGQAQTASTANDLTKASGYARAAMGSIQSARQLIEAAIGTTGLPSAATRPAPPTPQTTPTADQLKARASNDLARAYQDIVNAGTVARANGSAGDLGFYVTTAQNLYKQAYDLYNGGKSEQASRTAHAAQEIAHITNDLLRANGVTQAAPPVVTVPAPNF